MLREQRNLEGSAHTGPDFKKSSKNYDFLLEIEPVMCYIMPQKVFLKKQKNPDYSGNRIFFPEIFKV